MIDFEPEPLYTFIFLALKYNFKYCLVNLSLLRHLFGLADLAKKQFYKSGGLFTKDF